MPHQIHSSLSRALNKADSKYSGKKKVLQYKVLLCPGEQNLKVKNKFACVGIQNLTCQGGKELEEAVISVEHICPEQCPMWKT